LTDARASPATMQAAVGPVPFLLACGTPVVAFRNGSVPEVIDGGLTGWIVDTEDEIVAALDWASLTARGAARKQRNTFPLKLWRKRMRRSICASSASGRNRPAGSGC